MINTANINTLWGSLIIKELLRNGVDYFCISPGSRSTPLVQAVAQSSKTKHIICFDERGAAFHALGYARSSGKPAALISTSGTAAANYFPAVIEASADRMPLLILTADRPPELRQTAANQTIDQVGLFGKYPKWFFDLPCPDEMISPQVILSTIDQAVHQCRNNPKGPVHLNCMFREPLEPKSLKVDNSYLKSLAKWREKKGPYTSYSLSGTKPDDGQISEIAEIINKTKKGVLFVGRLQSSKDISSIKNLAKVLGWPVFPDTLSGLRLGTNSPDFIPYYDQMMLPEDTQEEFRPETILHLGGTFVSKRLLQFVGSVKPENYILVNDHPFRQDPAHIVTHRLQADLSLFREFLTPHLSNRNTNSEWLSIFQKMSDKIETEIDRFNESLDEINEISISRAISKFIPKNHALFLANSMPVRDMDMYGMAGGSNVRVGANRGVSGIDGTIASAAGFAAGARSPLTILIGDLAMIHDLNSLSQIFSVNQQITIVVLNNSGGGIFSFLPIANYDDIFEEYFGTPHQFTFENIAKTFGLGYFQPQTNREFKNNYESALESGKSSIIEIKTDRRKNVKLHGALQNSIIESLK
jgi:2-succinyl-5-enolpyruvyl-6-hydroxy-3-cyclohexene-1-carboxylate synthase